MSPNGLFTPDLQVAGRLRASAEILPLHDEFSSTAGDSIRQLMADVLERLSSAHAETAESVRSHAGGTGDIDLRILAAHLLDTLRGNDSTATADACLNIAGWAEKRSALRTASWFVAAAAAFKPADASIAVRAGKLARLQADYDGACDWLTRAIEVARATGASDSLADAYGALGFVQRKLGDFQSAVESHLTAARIALRHQLSDREARAYHNLAVLSFELDRRHDGISYGRKALDAYGRDRERILILANDLAWLWMDHDGAYAHALSIFQESLRSISKPANRIIILGNIARAAAGIRNVAAYRRAASMLEDLVAESPVGEGHAQGLLELAKGAALLGHTERAEETARRALQHALSRKENALLTETESFLANLRSGRPQPNRTRSEHSRSADERLNDLVSDLVLTLR
ncbi:MAG: tetratricopeptide repeat protein [Gemmatimonadetes bacterium]|nr:tetratricopeptide repeat protein [Gemmatimonadota bacterium]